MCFWIYVFVFLDQEERLMRKQKEYENEIKLLSGTIQRLESHLSEQTKSVAEVLFFVKFLIKSFFKLNWVLLCEKNRKSTLNFYSSSLKTKIIE
jgi:hypothetical protein